MHGLAEGEQVVVSGQFLIDSEARLRSVTGAMARAGRIGAASASCRPAPSATCTSAQGKVESVEADG